MATSSTRRRFLGALLLSGSSLTLMSTVLANNTNLLEGNDHGVKSWPTLQGEQLESLIGQSFSVYGQEDSCVTTLQAVYLGPEDAGRPADLVRKRSFTAIFTPMWEGVCPKGDQIALISHPDIAGEGSVFIMPKAGDDEKTLLEIVFN